MALSTLSRCGFLTLALVFTQAVWSSAIAAAAIPPVSAMNADCLPIDMPSPDEMFASKRIVFAHYFGSIFPLSFDNSPPRSDQYNAVWLRPKGKWAGQGGFLRSRPLGVEPGREDSFRKANYRREVRMAIARGITGFAYEFHDVKCGRPDASTSGCVDFLKELLAAAADVDPRFKVMLMIGGMTPDDATTVIKQLYLQPGMYRIGGRLVVAAFQANTLSPAEWHDMLSRLESGGFPIYFMPTFLSVDRERAAAFAPFSDAMGTFATASLRQAENITAEGEVIHEQGLPYMAGVSPQNYKPKEYVYFESLGSLSFRTAWEAAIKSEAAFIQLTTWNDFSESTQIAPYTDETLSGSIGTGFYNMNGYYAAWYLTGHPPEIKRDTLFYFYRRNAASIATPKAASPTMLSSHDPTKGDLSRFVDMLARPGALSVSFGDVGNLANRLSGMKHDAVKFFTSRDFATSLKPGAQPALEPSSKRGSGADVIELVGMLTKPGTLSISIGGVPHRFDASAGVQSFRIPLAPGRPVFSLERDGKTVISVTGAGKIAGPPGPSSGFGDWTYWSGTATASGLCTITPPL